MPLFFVHKVAYVLPSFTWGAFGRNQRIISGLPDIPLAKAKTEPQMVGNVASAEIRWKKIASPLGMGIEPGTPRSWAELLCHWANWTCCAMTVKLTYKYLSTVHLQFLTLKCLISLLIFGRFGNQELQVLGEILLDKDQQSKPLATDY